jgi:ribosomal protein S18 acetylase RimI-like enzyme
MSEATLDKHELDNQSIVIERGVPTDAEAIMTLKRDAWLGGYTSDEQGVSAEDINKKFGDMPTAINNWQRGIASETEDGERVTFVARINGKVVGFTAPCIENGQRRVGQLYVSPDTQGAGIGSKLLQKAVDWHGREQDIYLHVVSDNDKAIGFYEHFGFQKTGV